MQDEYRCPRCKTICEAGETEFIDCACGARWCTHCHPEYRVGEHVEQRRIFE